MSRADNSRKLGISACLQSWGPLKEKVDELYECEVSAIARLTSEPVKDKDVLNEHILQKKSLERIYQLVGELKEELHPNEPSEDDEDDPKQIS